MKITQCPTRYAWGYTPMQSMPVDRPIGHAWLTADQAKAKISRTYFCRFPSMREKLRDGLEITRSVK